MFYVETYLKINIALFIHSSAFYRYCRPFHSFLFAPGQRSGALLVLLITQQSTATKEQPYPYRRALPSTHRVLIKAGTSVVANNDGRPSLTRLGAIVEQVAEVSSLCAVMM